MGFLSELRGEKCQQSRCLMELAGELHCGLWLSFAKRSSSSVWPPVQRSHGRNEPADLGTAELDSLTHQLPSTRVDKVLLTVLMGAGAKQEI